MSTVSRGTSMQASSRSDEAPVNELTFTESERVASGLHAARNWRKLKGVELCSTWGPDPPPHSLPHQENFFPPHVKSRRSMSSAPPGLSPLRLPRGETVLYSTGRPGIRTVTRLIAALGYSVTAFPLLPNPNLSTLPPGVWHCVVVLGDFILFIVVPTESSDSSSLQSKDSSSSHNAPYYDSDNVDPDFPELGRGYWHS
jgi:hypothetical protein